VTNAPEGALTPILKNVEVTVQNKLHYCRKLSGQNSSMKINVLFLCTALLLNDSYLPMKFHGNAKYSFKVMLRTKIKNENKKWAITSKVLCL